VAIAAELLQLRPRPVTVTVDGVPSEHEVTLVAVGNTPCYGGGLRICPGAGPDDGLLEVVVVGPVSRRELVRTRPRLAAPTSTTRP
jgi:diacylglycerol kinase (ATP)